MVSANPLIAITGFTTPATTTDRFNHAGSAYSYTPASLHCWQSTAPVTIIGSANRSVSFWVQSANTPANTPRAAFSWGDGSANGANFGALESGVVGNNTWSAWLFGTADVPTGTSVTANWEHWVIASSGNNVSTYRNTVLINNAVLTTVGTVDSPLRIGCGATAGGVLGNLYQGKVDDVRVFNQLLTGTEVINLYEVTKP